MSYLEQLPNDVLYIIYEKKHRLEYSSVMIQLKRLRKPHYIHRYCNNSIVRVGDAVKTKGFGERLLVVIWKGKMFIDLYDYTYHNKHRINHTTTIIRPSTIDYIIKEIFANNK